MAVTTETNTTDASSASASASASALLSSLDRLNVASKKAVEVVNRFANIEPPSDDDDDDEADADRDDEEEEKENGINTNTNTNPWRTPQLIEDELNIARNELNEAWKNVKAERDNNSSAIATAAAAAGDGKNNYHDDDDDEEQKKEDSSDNEIPEEEFRVLYMNMMTDAFGDVLDTMNKENNNIDGNNKPTVDVDILVDCLQSGIDFLDPVEQLNKRSYFDSLDYNFGDDDDDDNDRMMNDDNDEAEEGLTIHEMKQRSLGYLVQSSS